jgi:hypothetical protein
MKIQAFVGIALVAVSTASAAADDSVPVRDQDACMEGPMAQFGRYIGDWDIEDSQLGQDGSTWAPANADKWNFVCIGNGTAVQDFWLPKGGNVGTNLRTWNPDTESWDIAWAIPGLSGFAHITAKQDDAGNIVMHYQSPVPDPLRRITFFVPDDEGWDWVQEWSTDGGESWFPVYRIRATRSE